MGSDQEIWSKFKAGDKDAYTSIYTKYVAGLLSYGKRFTDDDAIIEDCVHDLFVYLWKSRAGLSDTNSIIRYLLGAFRNNLLNAIKKHQKISLSENEVNEDFNLELSRESALIKGETNEENRKLVQKAMNSLSIRQKEAIYLKFYKKLANPEICEIMQLNNQSLRNLLSSSIKRMRGLMTKN